MVLRFTHNRWLWTALLAIAGGVLVWSRQVRDDAWLSGVLVPVRLGLHKVTLVHLSDSLSNPPKAVRRLVAVLDEAGGLENMQVSGVAYEMIMAQTGAVDPCLVRLEIKENRKLSPAEVMELVAAYEAGVSQRELARRFGVHEQTVRAHLRRQGMTLRPLRALTETQDAEAVRLYVDETWTLGGLSCRIQVRTWIRARVPSVRQVCPVALSRSSAGCATPTTTSDFRVRSATTGPGQ